MLAVNLVANHNFKLPHRVIDGGQPLATIICHGEHAKLDLSFVKQHIRWSAFHFADAEGAKTLDGKPPEASPLLAEGDVIVADLFDLLAGADPEELAQIKGLGPKKAAELIENAKAFVAERDAQAEAAQES
jgi:hypothetical protein